MYEYMRNNCKIHGKTLDGLMKFLDELNAHTRKRMVDFRGCKILHYHSLNRDNGMINTFVLDSSLKTGILKKDAAKGYFIPIVSNISIRKFIPNLAFLIDEMRIEEKNRTMFYVEDKEGKDLMFLGDTCSKTFPQRMPVSDFNSSLPRDIHLADKLNENLEKNIMRNTDGSRSNDLGVSYVLERFVETSEKEYFSKAMAFLSAREALEDYGSFRTFLDELKDMKANVVGDWKFDNKTLKVTMMFEDEKGKYDCGYIPAHTFYVSDTGFTKPKVVPTWIIDGNVSEISEDEVRIQAKSNITSFSEAFKVSMEKHTSEAEMFKGKGTPVTEKLDALFIDRLVSKTGMDNKSAGIRTAQINDFKKEMLNAIEKNPPETYRGLGHIAANILLKMEKYSESSQRLIQEVYSGKLLMID